MGIFDIIKHCVLTLFLISASYTDIKERIISDKLLLIMLMTGLAFSFIQGINGLILTFIGILTAGAVFIITYALSKGGLGAGDVKLAVCIAAFAGIYDFINIMIYSLIYIVITGIAVMLIKGKRNISNMPFAPYTAAGCITNIVFCIITL